MLPAAGFLASSTLSARVTLPRNFFRRVKGEKILFPELEKYKMFIRTNMKCITLEIKMPFQTNASSPLFLEILSQSSLAVKFLEVRIKKGLRAV